jgi:hypothetical protein
MTMSDDRLTEIRDLLSLLLEQARATGRKQDEVLESHRSAVASYRRMQRFGVVVIVVLLSLLAVLAVALFSTYG